MKSLSLLSLALLMVSSSAFAQPMANQNDDQKAQIRAHYDQYVENGRTYRDAFEALQYEIAYEQAAVHSRSPCRKLIRGL